MRPRKQSRSVKSASSRSQVPYGYRRIGGRLEIDPEEAAIVRQIFAEYIAAKGVITDSILDSMCYLHSRRAARARRPGRRL